jgi:hypothetical protein
VPPQAVLGGAGPGLDLLLFVEHQLKKGALCNRKCENFNVFLVSLTSFILTFRRLAVKCYNFFEVLQRHVGERERGLGSRADALLPKKKCIGAHAMLRSRRFSDRQCRAGSWTMRPVRNFIGKYASSKE